MKLKNIYAIIIGIENYRNSGKTGLANVEYAQNDAKMFKQVLVDYLNTKEENILLFLDQEATKTSIENEIPYFIKDLTEDDCFIFYYAGHGFYQQENFLTAWDTSPFNLVDTTVSINNILLTPFEKSNCKQNLIFLDACSRSLPKGRDLISDMCIDDFIKFATSGHFSAAFISSSPGEASYPCDDLQHGVWTWHLLRALRGEAPEAIFKNSFVTDVSLRDYLKFVVPEYHKKNNRNRRQTPMARLISSNTFIIRTLNPNSLQINPISLAREELPLEKPFSHARYANEDGSVSSLLNRFKKVKNNFELYYRTFLENENDQYEIIFKDDSTKYRGIPRAASFVDTMDNNETFSFQVLFPIESQEIIDISFKEIVSVKKIEIKEEKKLLERIPIGPLKVEKNETRMKELLENNTKLFLFDILKKCGSLDGDFLSKNVFLRFENSYDNDLYKIENIVLSNFSLEYDKALFTVKEHFSYMEIGRIQFSYNWYSHKQVTHKQLDAWLNAYFHFNQINYRIGFVPPTIITDKGWNYLYHEIISDEEQMLLLDTLSKKAQEDLSLILKNYLQNK